MRYPIAIGAGLLRDCELLNANIPGHDLLIVTNTTIAKLYLAKLSGSLVQRRTADCILPDGEQHKTLQTAARVFDALVEHKMNRDATIVALGGGVVGDIAGFAASCYQRGVGLRPAADHAAGTGRFVGGRKDRRESLRRQESDWRFLSAARRDRRYRCIEDPAGSRA